MVIDLLDKLLKVCGRNGFYPVQPRRESVTLEQLAVMDEIKAMENQLEAIESRRRVLLKRAESSTLSDDSRSKLLLQASRLEVQAVKLNNKIQERWRCINV